MKNIFKEYALIIISIVVCILCFSCFSLINNNGITKHIDNELDNTLVDETTPSFISKQPPKLILKNNIIMNFGDTFDVLVTPAPSGYSLIQAFGSDNTDIKNSITLNGSICNSNFSNYVPYSSGKSNRVICDKAGTYILEYSLTDPVTGLSVTQKVRVVVEQLQPSL